MKRPISILPLLIAGTLSIAAADSDLYIRRIDIIRRNVFDEQLTTSDNFIYRLGNKFHVVTRETVIRRELLFNEGEKFSEESLEQSLRNIRNLSFIGEAACETSRAAADSVDLTIITEDLWTTIFGIASEGGGGLYIVSFYGEEKNIAGLGIGADAELTFTSDNNDGYSLSVYDNRFVNSRYIVNFWHEDYAFNIETGVLLHRPFYSPDDRWSLTGTYQSKQARPRLFYQGAEYYRYKSANNYVNARVDRAFGSYTRIVPGIICIYNEFDYEKLAGYPEIGVIPDDEIFSGPGIGLKLQTFRYLTATYLDEFGTTEDLTENATLSLNAVWSGPTFNASRRAAYTEFQSGFLVNPIPQVYYGMSNIFSGYYENRRWQRMMNSLEALIYIKISTYQLLAAHFLSNFAWRQQPNYQILLGGSNGLRGYPERYFGGAKLAMMNLEYRRYTPIKILTVGLGASAFFDAGYVWRDYQSVNLRDFKRDVGLGLRFGLTKSSTARVVRIDLARALDRSDWYLSFGTENLFGLSRFQ